jgi:transposase-like protein
MGRKAKHSYATKKKSVDRCITGKTNPHHEAALLGRHPQRIREWISLYESLGDRGLMTSSKNTSYSASLKLSALQNYLNGQDSYLAVCKRYGIRSTRQLRNWIMKYNGHEKLIASGIGGKPIMTKGRKTTYDERIEIVEYCISHQKNYSEAAEKCQVSYQQVYSWTKKYENVGVEGLLDKCGHKKPLEKMSELERLRAENRLLKAQNKQQEMEIDFLKKLDEIERGRG